jgi:pimeloyl-ACP methyl ester carboxylesterase
LRDDYTTYSIDLFFHGSSRWENQRAIEKEDWKKIVQLFFDQERIENFEIAGFSIGAKFVLTTLELFSERVTKTILIAPDGINPNFWYSLATSTSIMRLLFRSMILKPKRLHFITKLVKMLNLENRDLLRFVDIQMSTEEKRKRVYYSWVYFRHLNFNLNDLSSLINLKNIPSIFFIGKFDKVIRPAKIIRFAKTLENHQIHFLDTNHNDLIEKSIAHLKV